MVLSTFSYENLTINVLVKVSQLQMANLESAGWVFDMASFSK